MKINEIKIYLTASENVIIIDIPIIHYEKPECIVKACLLKHKLDRSRNLFYKIIYKKDKSILSIFGHPIFNQCALQMRKKTC